MAMLRETAAMVATAESAVPALLAAPVLVVEAWTSDWRSCFVGQSLLLRGSLDEGSLDGTAWLDLCCGPS